LSNAVSLSDAENDSRLGRVSEESRYDHRLHGVLLVAQGMTCPEVSRLLGDAPRSVEYWIRRFEARGLAGLVEGGLSGRPRRLSESQLREIDTVLRRTPRDVGLTGTLWDGKTLRAWMERQLSIQQYLLIFESSGSHFFDFLRTTRNFLFLI